MKKIDAKLEECQKFYNSNKDKISSFLFAYFQLESYILEKLPQVKDNKKTISISLLKEELNEEYWDLAKYVFNKVAYSNITPLRSHRNNVVHNLDKRLESMNAIVNEYNKILYNLNNLFKVIEQL